MAANRSVSCDAFANKKFGCVFCVWHSSKVVWIHLTLAYRRTHTELVQRVFSSSLLLSVAHLFKWFPWVWRMHFADERAQMHSFLHIVWFNFYYCLNPYFNIHSDSNSVAHCCIYLCSILFWGYSGVWVCTKWKTNLSVRVQNEKAQLKEYKF